jgi:hypothetical protein
MAAGLAAGLLSGGPSTLHALWRGRDPLEASRAAGSLLGRPTLLRGASAHVALSLGWGVLLAWVLPRARDPRAAIVQGAAAGVGIAAIDLGLVGRRMPQIAALPLGPQVADHMLFGAVATTLLNRWATQPA